MYMLDARDLSVMREARYSRLAIGGLVPSVFIPYPALQQMGWARSEHNLYNSRPIRVSTWWTPKVTSSFNEKER